MSGGNIEIVRRYFECWSSPASEQRADVIELWDVDADYYPVRRFPEARPCHGVEEILQFLVGYLEAWSAYDGEIRDLIAVATIESWSAQPREPRVARAVSSSRASSTIACGCGTGASIAGRTI